MTSSAVLTEPTTNVESNQVHTAETATPTANALIDDAFYIVKQRWGTYVSHRGDGTPLITSLTEEACIAATRFWLKGAQEGWSDETKTYDSTVGGKL